MIKVSTSSSTSVFHLRMREKCLKRKKNFRFLTWKHSSWVSASCEVLDCEDESRALKRQSLPGVLSQESFLPGRSNSIEVCNSWVQIIFCSISLPFLCLNGNFSIQTKQKYKLVFPNLQLPISLPRIYEYVSYAKQISLRYIVVPYMVHLCCKRLYFGNYLV